jgi:hypothetical protein
MALAAADSTALSLRPQTWRTADSCLLTAIMPATAGAWLICGLCSGFSLHNTVNRCCNVIPLASIAEACQVACHMVHVIVDHACLSCCLLSVLPRGSGLLQRLVLSSSQLCDTGVQALCHRPASTSNRIQAIGCKGSCNQFYRLVGHHAVGCMCTWSPAQPGCPPCALLPAGVQHVASHDSVPTPAASHPADDSSAASCSIRTQDRTMLKRTFIVRSRFSKPSQQRTS